VAGALEIAEQTEIWPQGRPLETNQFWRSQAGGPWCVNVLPNNADFGQTTTRSSATKAPLAKSPRTIREPTWRFGGGQFAGYRQ